MRKTALLIVLGLALAVATLAAAPDHERAKGVPRFVSGEMGGAFTFENWGTPEALTNGDATGTLRHVGLARLYTQHEPNDDGTLRHGTFKIVDVNGDYLWGTYEGAGYWDANGYQVQADAEFAVSGGTGRFSHAKGTLKAVFVETFDQYYNCTVTWALEGTVTY
jgi:hypothetical protein